MPGLPPPVNQYPAPMYPVAPAYPYPQYPMPGAMTPGYSAPGIPPDSVSPVSTGGKALYRKPSLFSGSYLEWGHRATTSLLGIGADFQSRNHQIYLQSYSLRLRTLLSASPGYRLFVLAVPGLDVELTNSNETTRLREPVLRDLPLGLNLDLPLNEPGSPWASELRGTFAAILPVSRASRAAGYYCSLSPRLAWLQKSAAEQQSRKDS